MELRDYVRILRQRGWIILLLIIMTAAAAFGFSKLQPTVYKSSVDVLIQPARPDFGLTQSAKILLRSYVSWMNTEAQALKVIEKLDLDRTPGDLLSDVTIASDDSRFVIQINVEDENGDVANDIAREWRDFFIQWRNEENSLLRKEDQMMAVELDEPNYGLFKPKTNINVAAGAIFGALLGGLVVFVLEWIESGVVRRPEDIDRYLSLSVLGTIPAAKIDISRPYLLGGRKESVPTLAPPTPQPVAQIAPPAKSSPKASQPPVEQPPAQAEAEQPTPALMPPISQELEVEPAAQPIPPAVPEPEPEPEVVVEEPEEETPPPLTKAENEAGPVEPTILYSKGDEL